MEKIEKKMYNWCDTAKGKDKTILSPQNVVSCSDYNQGCEGG